MGFWGFGVLLGPETKPLKLTSSISCYELARRGCEISGRPYAQYNELTIVQKKTQHPFFSKPLGILDLNISSEQDLKIPHIY